MCFRRLLFAAFLLLLVSVDTAVFASDQPASGQTATESTAGRLTVTGRVVMPDGAAAAGAKVRSVSNDNERPVEVRTNEAGEFLIRGVFGNGCRLHATTTDGKLQATLRISDAAARIVLVAPVELKLRPATPYEVFVLADGKPAKGVYVVASGTEFRHEQTTDRDGHVVLLIPDGDEIRTLTAWHPQRGVDGRFDSLSDEKNASTTLSLRAPGPHTIRVVDPDGNGVDGLELSVNVRTKDSEWIVVREFEGARLQTDADGNAVVAWIPKDNLQFVEVNIISSDWKIDQRDLSRINEGMTTIHARRKWSVEGRLVMPEGASAEGILITGFGFGTKNHGDVPYARARRDGTFTLNVPANHGYVLGIADLEWASDIWSGCILIEEGSEPAPIRFEPYPATPVTVRVTRGPDRQPVANAWVDSSQRGRVEWDDDRGQKHSGEAHIHVWLRTGADGDAKMGVARGEQVFRLSTSTWSSTQTIAVGSSDPLIVEFHRAWLGERHVTGQLTLDDVPYKPSPTVKTYAGGRKEPVKTSLQPDGAFDITFDAETTSLLIMDPMRRLSGYAQIGPDDSMISFPMQELATFGGALADESGRPLGNQPVMLEAAITKRTYLPVAKAITDGAGRFRFLAPSGVPLQMQIPSDSDHPQRYIPGGNDMIFEPAEVREDVIVKVHQDGVRVPAAVRRPISLSERVKNAASDASMNGMLTALILQGDDSADVVKLTDQLVDDDIVTEVLRYLPVVVTAEQLDEDVAFVAARKWSRPAAGEVVVLVLNADQKILGSEVFKSTELGAADERCATFFRRHALPVQDSAMLLAEAVATAKASNRRIWFVEGGPRCGPCFRLARWMRDHHQILAKDFVIVKVMGGIDEHVEDVAKKFGRTESGIPWFAIAEPDGPVLITSDGDLGNIGLPTTIEDLRHFRRMLEQTVKNITADELNAILRTLSAEK